MAGTTYRLVRTPPPTPAPPELDAAQRAVVEHPEGPLLVLAGPGTGKTTTLVECVIDRVHNRGLTPEQVLVLTFSRKAAGELRGRIATRLATTIAEPAAWTFHAWCAALVRAWPATPGAEPPRLLSGAERDVRIRELLTGNAQGEGKTRWPSGLRAALTTRGFAHEVADLLDRVRERGLDTGDLAKLGAATERPAWVSAATFLDEYLDVLDQRNETDYAGLVRSALALLDRPEVLNAVRDRYRAVFVDEYQDTDPAQEQLLQLLAGQGRDLVVVGDPDQSIYAFRGADVSCLLDFPDRFPARDGVRAPVLTLEVSRRAGPVLRAVAKTVATALPAPGLNARVLQKHRELTPSEGLAPGTVDVRLYATVADEVAAIADELRRAHLQHGVPWSEMAVLVRSGVRSIPVLRRAFAAAGVPVAVAADELPVARDPAVAPLLAILRCAVNRGAMTPDIARQLLLSPLGRALPSGLRLLGRRLRALDRETGRAVPRASSLLIRDAVLEPGDVTTVEDWAAEPVRRIAGLIAAARQVLSSGGTAEEALWAVWEQSGWGRRLAGDSGQGGAAGRAADRDLDAVLALFSAAARLEQRQPHSGVKTLLDELEAQEIPGRQMEERAISDDAVRLLTAHRAKGLEWRLVVVAGVQEGVWPDLRRRGSLLEADLVSLDEPRPAPTAMSLLTEERRLFYVALTRARERLIVTAVQSLDDAGARPSRFVSELGVDVPAPVLAGTSLLSPGSLVARLRRATLDDAHSPELRAAAAGQLAELARARDGQNRALVPSADPTTWWGLREVTTSDRPVRPTDEPVRLSGSAVRSYDTCPLAWFLEREVGAATPTSTARGFGSVVHALAHLVGTEALPADVDALLARLDDVWAGLGFEAAWLADRERDAARAALSRFLVWHADNPRQLLGSEEPFDVVIGGVRLRGTVDRLEVDHEGRLVVVDLKTGKSPPTKADVELDPQLGVYQLAVREGAFNELVGSWGRPALGGAELVQLRADRAAGRPAVQPQPPLEPDADGVIWVQELVTRTAEGIAGEQYPARPGPQCTRCDFAGSCPATDAGRQVVS